MLPLGTPTAEAGAPAVAGGTISSSGAAVAPAPGIAYPYPGFAGSPSVAADHTIVVTGSGQTVLAADGSDRTAGEKTALDAALADATAQATRSPE